MTVGGENPPGATFFPSLFHLGTSLWGGAAHIQGASSTMNSSLGKTHSEVQVIGLLGISQSRRLTTKTLCPRIPWRSTEMQNMIPEFVSHIRKDSKKVSHVAYLSATLSSHRMSCLSFFKLFILFYLILFSLSSLTFAMLVTSPLSRLFYLWV